MLDAAGQHVFGFQFKPVAVAVLCLDLDLFGAGNGAVVAGKRQAAFIQFNGFVAQVFDFGVDELNKSIFVIGGGIFRAVAVIQTDENAAHHANLGAGKAKTVSIHQGILHIIQQGGKAVIKFGNGAADLFQDRVTIFYDCTKSHNKNPP